MKLLFIILAFNISIFLSNSQTYNPAQYKQATMFDRTITGMQLGGVGVVYMGYKNNDNLSVLSGFLFIAGLKVYRNSVKKRNLKLYFKPNKVGLVIPITQKRSFNCGLKNRKI